tara:strand:- start:1999 stop:2766 length:768 start_codon:yes stop_codon:yes gene_type:complete
MAVSVDTVYQKVLALANKEQRGYITPQEFNLFADHAQKEIFEQYFYDVNQFKRVPGNNTNYSDMINNLEEKISLFEVYDKSVNVVGSYGEIFLTGHTGSGNAQTPNLYRLGMVRVRYSNQSRFRVAEEIQLKDLNTYSDSPLGRWSKNRPVYTRYTSTNTKDKLKVYPFPSSDSNIDQALVSYVKKPTTPKWGYVVINDKPLYNSSSSVNFDLHPSEETELVYRILTLSGIAIEKPQLSQLAGSLGAAQIQQEKQ